MKRVVVVGGVAGGMSFATRYRRLNEEDHIIVLDKGPYVSFANCGLPYYVSGDIEARDDLIVAEQAMLQTRFQLDVRVNHEVVAIDPDNKVIDVVFEGERSQIAYDRLVLSPGAKAFIPETKGLDVHPHIHTLRNIPDVDAIMETLPNASSALVIGAGFIGLEMVESLVKRGLKVSLVEKAPQVLAPFDEEMAIMAHNELLRNDVDVYVGTAVEEFSTNTARLETGEIIAADLVIMSVGVQPQTDFIQEAGIVCGLRGGIVVDDVYQTSHRDIYAVGDAIIVKHLVSGEDALLSLASPANRQGRQLADHLSGIETLNRGSLGTAILRLFDLSFASTGLNERQLKGRDYQVLHILGKSHAGYFPGATPLHLKVIYDRQTHDILGAQAVGEKGADKRIDVLATAIKAGYKVEMLQELELSYAPPFGSAKDPVNMAGYYAQNINLNLSETVQWHHLREVVDEGAILIDVRSVEEYQSAHIEGSLNMPLDSIRCELHQLDMDQDYIVHCQSGVRSYNAERILKQAGFKVRNLDGSFALYSRIRPKEIVSHV